MGAGTRQERQRERQPDEVSGAEGAREALELDDRIVADTVFCGGRWDAALLAEMEAADA